MGMYLVRCFANGLPDGPTHRNIQAETFLEAAQFVCQEALHVSGPTSHIRVKVWVQNTPGLSMTFYSDKLSAPKRKQHIL
jgi:hypothetical protein